MNKKLIAILIANLFVAAPAFAQSDFKLTGSVSIGGINVDDKNAADASKLNEFRDLSDGGLVGFDIAGRGSRYWLELFGENLGRDDHYVNLRGGSYGVFKYRLYTDQLKHNFLFGGRTPYANAGSSRVTATLPSTNPATWNSVDIGYKRRDDGGYVEFQGASPWYFRVDGNQVTQSGTKLGSASGGMSPGNGMTDILFPTQYTTRNATVEGGYSTKTMHFALSWMTSKFESDDDFVDWTNGYFKGVDRTYLAADNKYSRLAGNATIRKLPLNSTLALRFTNDEMKSDQTLGTTVLGANGSILTTLPNVPTYNGKVEHKTYTLALASAPAKNLDTRLYVNRWKRDDKSTHLIFTGTASSGEPYTNEPMSIDKKNWGFDAFYRINRQNRVGFGYDDLDLERERADFNKTEDKKWFVEWKTSMIENVSARLKYTDLKRTANFLHANDGVNSGDVLYWNRFLRAYDATDADQKSWKGSVDFTPAEYLDVTLEGTWKETKYKETVIGRLQDRRHEIYGSVSYGNPESARWTVFGDIEKVKYDSRHMVVPFGSTAIGTYDPFAAPSSSKYNWEGFVKDDNWALGVSLDLPATEKLMVKASVVYYKSDGSVDFASNRVGAPPAPMANYDDTKRTSFNLKGIYKLSKAITLTAGYAYEKYDFKDVQVDGFQYVIPGNSGADSYFTGYLANPQYKANIVYGLLTWNF